MSGIHPVTAIAGDPLKNLDFYTCDLGAGRIWSVQSCRPGTRQPDAAAIGLIFVGALSAFFDQNR
jgi:hypothetical protein